VGLAIKDLARRGERAMGWSSLQAIRDAWAAVDR